MSEQALEKLWNRERGLHGMFVQLQIPPPFPSRALRRRYRVIARPTSFSTEARRRAAQLRE
jgi:hypothetical protein